jgi:hypothetical protein
MREFDQNGSVDFREEVRVLEIKLSKFSDVTLRFLQIVQFLGVHAADSVFRRKKFPMVEII